jgi:DNA modification methylase
MSKREPWRNRIIGHGEQPAISFMANPLNWRIHPKAQRDALTGILGDVGWVQSVIVNKTTGNVVDGHARIEEALKLGDDTPVPFVEVELSEEEEQKILLTLDPVAAMATADKANLDALLRDVSTTSEAMQEMLADLAKANGLDYGAEIGGSLEDAEPQIDKGAELAAKWGTARGQIWQLGEHRLMCGDSTSADDVARLMDGERAELLFTSPPYADMRDYKGGDMAETKLSEFILAFSSHVMYQAVNLGVKRAENEIVEYWQEYISAAKRCGYKLLSWNVWDQGQNGAVGKLTAMFPIEHEFVFVFGAQAKKLVPTVPNKTAGYVNDHVHDRQSDGGLTKKQPIKTRPMRELGTVIRCPPQLARNVDAYHPAMFPVEFPKAYIEAMSNESDYIAEPFSGSGTTLMACEQLNRKCRAMEIAPEYVAVALERWATATGKTPVLVTEVTE